MPRVRVLVKSYTASQQVGQDASRKGRVFCSIAVDGEHKGEFFAEVEQLVGDDAFPGKIEVSPPQAYQGPFSQPQFSKRIEQYIRNNPVLWTGSGVRVVLAVDCGTSEPYSFEFEADEPRANW